MLGKQKIKKIWEPRSALNVVGSSTRNVGGLGITTSNNFSRTWARGQAYQPKT